MNDLIDKPVQKTDEIKVKFIFANTETYIQPVPMANADWIEELLEWYRNPKSRPTWTWNHVLISEIVLFQKTHIMSIEIEGYIELSSFKYKWHEKVKDKFKTFMYFKALKQYNLLKTWIKK